MQVYGRSNGAKFRVASNPEFLREGTAVGDFFHPDRIVVGVEDAESEQQLREIYQPFLEGTFRCPVHQPHARRRPAPVFLVTTIASAELIKHASNSFLGLKISYANRRCRSLREAGRECGRSHARRGAGSAHRHRNFLNAGLGFGGFCLPKDIQAFIHLAESIGVDFTLLREAER